MKTNFLRLILSFLSLLIFVPNQIIAQSEGQAIVIEIGDGYTKAGFSGSDSPKAIFRTVVGRNRMKGMMVGSGAKEAYVGDEALSKRSMLNLNYPVQSGIVNNWNDYKAILKHIFENELRVLPENYPVIITEMLLIPKEQREKIAKILFEEFNVPAIFGINRGLASLMASGKETGLIIESNYDVTTFVPIVQNYYLPHAISKIPIGGISLTEYLAKLMTEKGYSFTTETELLTVEKIKDAMCYVAVDYNSEMSKEDSEINKDFELPDGQVVRLSDARFRCPEALFNPSYLGSEFNGIHTEAFNTIMKCNIDFRADLFQNIILSGNNTLFSNLDLRLANELKKLASGHSINVSAPVFRSDASWIGASIFSSNQNMSYLWVTIDQYNENGVSIIHSKFL